MQARATLLVSLLLLVSLAPVTAGRQPPATVSAGAEAIRLNNLGVASMNQQKPEVALERFEAAAKADPSLTAATLNQAIAMIGLQRYEPAQATLERLVKEDPSNARAWYNLGLLLRTLGDADAALAAFTRVTELAPSDPYAHYFRGLLASQAQQHDLAIAAFQRAMAIDPFLVSAEFGLARAYQRSGRADDAKRHMERFTRLTQEKIASAMSLSYGDQGPLSLALAVQPAKGGQPAAIPVKFVAQPQEPGEPLDREKTPGAVTTCVIDADGDGRLDYVRVHPVTGATLMRQDASGRHAAGAQIAPRGARVCAVGDVDNDEKPDVAIAMEGDSTTRGVIVVRNLGGGRFDDKSPVVVLKNDGQAWMYSLALVDFDHDADLDVVITRLGSRNEGTAAAMRNNGDGTFADVTAERGLGVFEAWAVVATDVNNDRAVDLVFAGAEAQVLINQREGAFKRIGAIHGSRLGLTKGVAVLDFDKDGWMDLAFTHQDAPGISLWRNHEGKAFGPASLPSSELRGGFGIAALDYDNDGEVDLAATGTVGRLETARSELQVLRNIGGRFEDTSAAVGAARLGDLRAIGLAAADFDGDIDVDLMVTSSGAPPTILRNEGGNANNAVRISLAGLNDNRSGIGTKVEVQAGTVWQKFESTSSASLAGSGSPEILAGIGKATAVDVVRLLWPTGVVQDEVELKANTRHVITQIDRRGSSCPVLFSWNGERYEFIADAIGPAVVGHWVAPGTRNIPDVDELVKVEGRHVTVKDGRLSFRFAEPMEEVIYLDQVKLFAIDHPEGTDVYPNEYFAALPPHPADRPIASRGARLPLGAWDGAGRDVMQELGDRDRVFVEIAGLKPRHHTSSVSSRVGRQGFSPAFDDDDSSRSDDVWRQGFSPAFKGFAPLHSIELDLGGLPPGAPVRLLMHGFTDYFTANSVFAAHQAGVTPVVPWVEARMPDGSWRRIADDIGFPAGLLRTMTADLTGKLPPGARRIRIWTNLKIYWDQILVDTTPAGAVPMTRREIPLAEASLAFRGFPREVTGNPAADLQYVHGEVSKYGPYARHRGFYTKYGTVTPLLRHAEDRFVIFGAGDEVALEFDAAALPPLPAGWTRDYFVYFNGYVKDMDFYAAHAQTVAPLPFKGMPGYPYPDGTAYPDRHREYLLEWNTREVSDEGWPSYRFDYGSDDTARHNREVAPASAKATARPRRSASREGGKARRREGN